MKVNFFLSDRFWNSGLFVFNLERIPLSFLCADTDIQLKMCHSVSMAWCPSRLSPLILNIISVPELLTLYILQIIQVLFCPLAIWIQWNLVWRLYFRRPQKHPGQNTKEFLCLCSEGTHEKRAHIEQAFHPPFHTSDGAFIQLGWLTNKTQWWRAEECSLHWDDTMEGRAVWQKGCRVRSVQYED